MKNNGGSNILDRIRKVLVLARRGGTPEEAATAAAKVQELLFAHNLTLAQVELAELAGSDYLRVNESVGAHSSSWKVSCRRYLLTILARHNFCRMIHTGDQFAVIGRRHDAEAALSIYRWLDEYISAAAARNRTGPGTAPLRSFYFGAVSEISGRLHDQRQRDEQQAGGQALVLASDSRLKIFTQKLFPHPRKVDSRSPSDYAAWQLGKQTGRTVALGRPLQKQGGRVLTP